MPLHTPDNATGDAGLVTVQEYWASRWSPTVTTFYFAAAS